MTTALEPDQDMTLGDLQESLVGLVNSSTESVNLPWE